NKPRDLAEKPYDRFNTNDENAPLKDIQPTEAAKLLNTPPGKELPPISERFESNALKQLGPEEKPTIYVAKDPNDKAIPPGATTYRTINDAIKHAFPGSVIQVMPGNYNERINLSGEPHSNITLQTDRNHPAVIDGGNINIGSNAHDITIRNFE